MKVNSKFVPASLLIGSLAFALVLSPCFSELAKAELGDNADAKETVYDRTVSGAADGTMRRSPSPWMLIPGISIQLIHLQSFPSITQMLGKSLPRQSAIRHS